MNACVDFPGQAAPHGRTWVEVDRQALVRNIQRVLQHVPAQGRLILSAKKDAYGHGMAELARLTQGMDRIGPLAVATAEEGLALRAQFPQTQILCFAVLEGPALEQAIAADIILSITQLSDAQAVAAAARAQGKIARVHFKLDTGMGRMGLQPREVAGEVPAIMALEGLRVEAVYSHLAAALEVEGSALHQFEKLERFREQVGWQAMALHWGGSDAIVLTPHLPAGASLRSGIALYGDHPLVEGLEPVMTFKSRVIFRRRVPVGTCLSYGMTFTTAQETELAVVGVGYGNGYPRSLSAGGMVLLRGVRCPVLGRVCMDQIIVDATHVPGVQVGEEAVLFGRQGEAILPARQVAGWAGTISYELFCLAGQINPRVYVG